jgi:hypothetical protein
MTRACTLQAVHRKLPLVIAVLLALTGCGGNDRSPGSGSTLRANGDADSDGVLNARDAAPQDASVGAKVVRGKVDLKQGGAAVPDGGTMAGHHAEAIAITSRSALTVTGRVEPATARVSARERRSARLTHAVVNDHGKFHLTLRGLHRGQNDFTLLGRAPGHDSWRIALSVTRR